MRIRLVYIVDFETSTNQSSAALNPPVPTRVKQIAALVVTAGLITANFVVMVASVAAVRIVETGGEIRIARMVKWQVNRPLVTYIVR